MSDSNDDRFVVPPRAPKLYVAKSTEERIALLNESYDNALVWQRDCAVTRNGKGSGVAERILSSSGDEIRKLQEMMGAKAGSGGKVLLTINNVRLEDIQTGDNDD